MPTKIKYNFDLNEIFKVNIMQQNYSQRLEIQIPKENNYTGLNIEKNSDDEFDKLLKNYEIRDSEKVKNFIGNNEDILDYIDEITPLINRYFPNNRKFIEFCEDPEFSDLDFVMIYIECSIYEKDKKILAKFKNEPLYMSKFSRNIHGLVCVELW